MFSRRTLLLVPGAAVGAVGAATLLGPLVGRSPDLTPPPDGTAVRTDAGDGRLRLVPENGGRVRSLEVPVGAGRFGSTAAGGYRQTPPVGRIPSGGPEWARKDAGVPGCG